MDDNISIGESSHMPWHGVSSGDTVVGKINLTELCKENKELQARVDHLQTMVEKQQDMILKLWFSPGMPGMIESKDSFSSTRDKT